MHNSAAFILPAKKTGHEIEKHHTSASASHGVCVCVCAGQWLSTTLAREKPSQRGRGIGAVNCVFGKYEGRVRVGYRLLLDLVVRCLCWKGSACWRHHHRGCKEQYYFVGKGYLVGGLNQNSGVT